MAQSSRELERRVLERLSRHVEPGASVVVAVSGGGDSMALLALASRLRPALRWRLRPLHVDHGMRAESAAEARWVQEYCYRQFGWPVRVARIAVARSGGESLEGALRRQRYQCLEEFRRASGSAAILLAHQWEDQAETVLMRVLSGTGIFGLRAMAVRRGPLLRPLLPERRATLRAYLQELGLQWLEDPTNQDPRWLRNRLRHELMPLLRQHYNPAVERALWRLAEEAQEWAEWVEAVAEDWLKSQGLGPGDSEWRLSPSFHALPRPVRAHLLLRYAQARGIRLSQVHVRQALRATTQWPGGTGVEHFSTGGLRVGALMPSEATPWLDQLFPIRGSEVELPRGGRLVVGGEGAPFHSRLSRSPDQLAVRFWRPGDRLRPVGLHGTKKLQDLFVDLKIPRGQRPGWPLLVPRERPEVVLAVVGLAVDESAAGTEWLYGYWPPQS
ncbi:MAG: tRNA lysidine(34) synthetase TilS [Firmicutes bacterium]|nr:tRNA lysidine(34) synthetase TilS [Bacillota bacterium]